MDYFSSDKLIEPAKGDLLISEPYLPDPNFDRTVILICEHDENGTIGFVLNRGANIKLPDVLEESGSFDPDLFVGGPVEQDTLHFIHRSDHMKESSNVVAEGVRWGHDFDELLSLVNTGLITKSDIRLFLGYSGWSPGQLLDEMKAKSWIVFKNASAELIFDRDNHELWKECLKSMGGKFRLISNYPKDPRLN
ncbi:MAG: YqgE/AlgH family protein [Cyclobacteriaceae bacterium]